MVLAKIDPRLLQTALAKTQAQSAQAAAAVAKARANHEQANKAFARAKALKEQGLMGQADYDLAETAVNATKADIAVAQAQAALANAATEEARVNIGFTTIVSPIDGIVLSTQIDVGQTVAASLQSPTLFTIAQDLHAIQVDTFVAEADVGKLAQGMDATFSVDAYPGVRFKGKVREVRNASQTVQNVVTYDAVLDVQNDELKLKPGMTANVTFIWAEKDAVLKVPNAALRFKPPAEALAAASGSASGGRRRFPGGGPSGSGSAPGWSPGGGGGGGGGGGEGGMPDPNKKTVWVLNEGKPRPVRIETGITDGQFTEVVGGHLNEGDEVITEYVTPESGATAGTGSARPPGMGGGGGGGRSGGGRMF
jgi:HlyD family secretion protein